MPRPSSLLLLLAAGPARGQFGYDPPAPICPAFSCPSGQKAVGNPDHQIWSYGCKDSGMNVFNAGSFDPSNPYAGLRNPKSVDKCCIERDICKQTCGMTSKACHDNFKKCSTKICKGDQNCQLQAMMSDIMSEPYDPEEYKKEDYKYDPEAAKCKGYKRGQSESCKCVPQGEWLGATTTHLKAFYKRFNPEKLNKKGEIKEVDEVWKKWKGKESEMFMALATKYKEKAVEIRQKPKPPPYEPPKDRGSSAGSEDQTAEAEEHSAEEPAQAAEEPPPTPAGGDLDADDTSFEEKHADLEARKQKAAEDEDYDLADKLKEEAAELVQEEIKRLKAKKAQSIDDEDYREAKRVKQRLAKLEL